MITLILIIYIGLSLKFAHDTYYDSLNYIDGQLIKNKNYFNKKRALIHGFSVIPVYLIATLLLASIVLVFCYAMYLIVKYLP